MLYCHWLYILTIWKLIILPGLIGLNTNLTQYTVLLVVFLKNTSQLKNIFLIQLHKSEDHNECGNNLIFSNIIEQIKETDGIIIATENSAEKVNFVLLHILGDNLCFNTILEFSMSFNSNYSCCLADKTTIQSQVVEDFKLKRLKVTRQM